MRIFSSKKFQKKFLHHSFIRMIVNTKNEDIFVKKISKKSFYIVRLSE